MRKITWTLLVGLLFLLTNCSEEYEERVRIRVRNIGPYNYDGLLVNSNGSDVNFGTIKANTTSKYRPFKYAYEYAFIKFSIDGIEYKCIPDDYMGEEKLERGKYTYQITTDSNKKVKFEFIRD